MLRVFQAEMCLIALRFAPGSPSGKEVDYSRLRSGFLFVLVRLIAFVVGETGIHFFCLTICALAVLFRTDGGTSEASAIDIDSL